MACRVFSGLSSLFPWDNGNHPFATISLLILSQKKRALTALLFIATRDTLDDIIRHVLAFTLLFDDLYKTFTKCRVLFTKYLKDQRSV